jgi:hypothetical protein
MVSIAVDNPEFANQPKRDAGGNFGALLAHWNFPASISTLRVYTFTNRPMVELKLNGRSLGEKRAADFADPHYRLGRAKRAGPAGGDCEAGREGCGHERAALGRCAGTSAADREPNAIAGDRTGFGVRCR